MNAKLPTAPAHGPHYWRSLDELADQPEFRAWVEREFPAGASELHDPLTRRYFMKLMSASFLLAGLGLTGCRRPEEKIMPFSKQPEDYIHGVPQFYATSFAGRGHAVPLVVRSNDGRPTKIEGNALHPDSNGGTDHFSQASILNLYDPDRAMRFTYQGNNRRREEALDALAALGQAAAGKGGQGLHFLMERSSSVSRQRLQEAVSGKLPQAQWHIYEPVDLDIPRRAATLAFGKPCEPYYKLDDAKAILSFDADFLGAEEDTQIHARRFAKGRRQYKSGDPMSRLYVIEAVYSLTGANADHRLRLPASQVAAVAARAAIEVFEQTKQFQDLIPALRPLAEPAKAHEAWIVECARDLLAQGNASVALAGHRQPLVVHLIAQAINAALGSVGKTVELKACADPKTTGIAELAEALKDGKVEALVILGGNPVYNAPAGLRWRELQRKAKTVVRLGYYEDETFEVCDWHLPLAHYLESWGDARTADGTVVPVQPLIEPLFGGLTEIEVLARLGGLNATRPHDIARETLRGLGAQSEDGWKKFLHDGFLANSATKAIAGSFQPEALSAALKTVQPAPAPTKGQLEIVFLRSHQLDDGRFNNNGWLQEIPDPITKLSWDNAVLISPKTAQELGIGGFDAESREMHAKEGLFFSPIVEVELNGATVRGPVWIQPGLADNTVVLTLGYGREKSGRIGRLADGSPAGFNAYLLKAGTELLATGAKLSVVPGATRQLATTQAHGAMEGRPLVREASKAEFDRRPDFAVEMELDAPSETGYIPHTPQGTPKSIYQRPEFHGMHQWGMAIDLSACVGCMTCVFACQSENNVPIVGKEQVAKGREMHWIRFDRYFAGNIYDPQIAYQPVFCLHCENAPCENVCPVNATTHDSEGLNVMTYNRCVGTRYCSNNCPYKVRRFNFFDYNRRPRNELYKSPFTPNKDGQIELLRWFKDRDKGTVEADEWDLLKLARNPDVTVRMRGVMEKCTYCVQRIEQAKIARKVQARASGDVRLSEQEGTVPKTACQQACPAEAIVFGDLSDPQSQVARQKLSPLNYSLLGFLDTRPRTTYLARVRNPNPKMPDYDPARPGPQTLNEYLDRRAVTPLREHPGGAEGHHEAAAELRQGGPQ